MIRVALIALMFLDALAGVIAGATHAACGLGGRGQLVDLRHSGRAGQQSHGV